MNKICFLLAGCIATSLPVQATTDIEDALNLVPTLEELCGAVPDAPAKVRGDSPFRPVRRAAKAFIKDTDQWLSCAVTWHATIQPMVSDIRDDKQRSALAAHLNDDYRQQYDALNEQIAIFADRINHRMTWLIRPEKPSVGSSGVGLSSNVDNVRLRTVKRLTMKADINRPIYQPNRKFLEQTVLVPPQFAD